MLGHGLGALRLVIRRRQGSKIAATIFLLIVALGCSKPRLFY